jgi:FixJ family two-component response regulator
MTTYARVRVPRALSPASEMTVKVHRGQVMRKMRAKSLVDLVRMADKLGISARQS